MSSLFDPDTFLDATITAPLSKRPALPPTDYVGVIGAITSRAWTGKADPTKSGVALDIVLTLELPPEVQSALGLNQATLSTKDSIMLDLTPSGALDLAPGRNRKLRMYREAVDMNKVGDAFSPRSMEGKVVKVKISHELYQESIQERVAAVAKLS